ncbi:MAG: hypothetical protein L6461_03715 [Anaerolineae bacterium]|nr:hypothetical protein [Anaerolineae bacterium]
MAKQKFTLAEKEQQRLRKLDEEVGLNFSLSLWKRYNYEYAPNIIVDQHIFVGKVDSENSTMILGEGQAMNFFNYQDTKELKIGFGFENILSEYDDLRNNEELQPHSW